MEWISLALLAFGLVVLAWVCSTQRRLYYPPTTYPVADASCFQKGDRIVFIDEPGVEGKQGIIVAGKCDFSNEFMHQTITVQWI